MEKKDVNLLALGVVFIIFCIFLLLNQHGMTGKTTKESMPCYPNWSCYSWGDCGDGEKTRKCFDINDCGLEVGRPVEKKDCTTSTGATTKAVQETTGSSNKLIITLGILVGFIIFVAVVLIASRKKGIRVEEEPKKEKIVASGIEEIKKEIETRKADLKKEEVIPVNISSAENYVKAMLKKGKSKDLIKDDLLKVGWSEEIVADAITKGLLEDYVFKELRKGVPREVIKDTLIKRGWKRDLVERII